MRLVVGTKDHRLLGLTLPELMISLAIFSLVVGSVVSAHVFGLRIFGLTEPKLAASQEARKIMNLLVSDIHAAAKIRLGTGSASSFQEIPAYALQQGNALQLWPDPNSPMHIRYFRDPNDGRLKRKSTVGGDTLEVVGEIGNPNVFRFENFEGVTLTSAHRKYVIGITLEFSRLYNGEIRIGPGYHYDSFELKAKIHPRDRD